MSGWRARIGLLVPSVNTIVEPDFYSMTPEGVALITARLHVPTIDLSDEAVHGNLENLVAAVDDSVHTLPLEELVGIAFCCTAASFYQGGSWDEHLAAHITAISGKPSVTTSGAMIAGLRRLEVKRVGVASPYVASLNRELTEFLETNGFQVVRLSALESESAYENARLSRRTIYELVRDSNSKEAEALFIPCTNLPAAELVEQLEVDLGKPVVAANPATFWQILRATGIRQPVAGFGRLLREPE